MTRSLLFPIGSRPSSPTSRAAVLSFPGSAKHRRRLLFPLSRARAAAAIPPRLPTRAAAPLLPPRAAATGSHRALSPYRRRLHHPYSEPRTEAEFTAAPWNLLADFPPHDPRRSPPWASDELPASILDVRTTGADRALSVKPEPSTPTTTSTTTPISASFVTALEPRSPPTGGIAKAEHSVDGPLHRPRLHFVLSLGPRPCLSDVSAGPSSSPSETASSSLVPPPTRRRTDRAPTSFTFVTADDRTGLVDLQPRRAEPPSRRLGPASSDPDVLNSDKPLCAPALLPWDEHHDFSKLQGPNFCSPFSIQSLFVPSCMSETRPSCRINFLCRICQACSTPGAEALPNFTATPGSPRSNPEACRPPATLSLFPFHSY